MRILLDTHTLLWFSVGDSRISQTARDLVEDVSVQKHLSVVSAWEIAIKYKLGKLDLEMGYESFMKDALNKTQCSLLPISLDHLTLVSDLELHHRDPFDRMIVAQSIAEEMPLVSADDALDKYAVERVWK